MNLPLCSSLTLLISALAWTQTVAAQEPTAAVSLSATTQQASAGVGNDGSTEVSPSRMQNGANDAAKVSPADAAAVAVEGPDAAPSEVRKETEVGVAEADKGKGKEKARDEAKGDDGGKKLPWETKPKIRVGGLIHTEFSINDAPADPETPNYDFRLTNARVFLTWEQGSLLDAQAEIELSRDRDRNPGAWAPMRDAFVRVSPDRALRLRMGQFKRPFGGLQMISLRDIKLVRRGISDTWINEELLYGERDTGFQVEGKLGKGLELHYALGVFNGSGRNRRDLDPNGVKDLVGRLEGHFGKHLTVAYDFANKRFDRDYVDYASYPTSTWMSGVDVLVEYAGLWGYIEGQYGTNYRSSKQNHTASALAMLAYKFPVSPVWEMAIEPLLKGEVLKLETEIPNRRILNATAGVNYYIGDIFRLMLQGEWIDNEGLLPSNLAEAESEKRLLVQAGMYTR